MPDHIPLDIQAQILKRLPVKSLLRFRSVSKQWKSLIESSNFISGYGVHHTQPHRLLLRYKSSDEKYVSLVDDDNTEFSTQQFDPSVPVLAKLLEYSRVVGSSHGLLCLFSYSRDPTNFQTSDMAVLWNPSIRKSIGVIVPGDLDWQKGEIAVGFGVCPATSDPKIVQIRYDNRIISQVLIFTLSSGIWKTLSSSLPRASIVVTWRQVAIDRFIYWIAYDRVVDTDGNIKKNSLILSFDTFSDEFELVALPDTLSQQQFSNFEVSNLNGSLVVLEEKSDTDFSKNVYHVWIMDDNVTKSFAKLFTIVTPYEPARFLIGFRKNGEPIFETQVYHNYNSGAIELYESCSRQFTEVGIYGINGSFFVSSYMESLILLDHLDGFVYS